MFGFFTSEKKNSAPKEKYGSTSSAATPDPGQQLSNTPTNTQTIVRETPLENTTSQPFQFPEIDQLQHAVHSGPADAKERRVLEQGLACTQQNDLKATTTPSTHSQDLSSSHNKPQEQRNLLMISTKRPRAFYERAARELLASGHETIQLSALGDALLLAIQLANNLRDKKAAYISKIETKTIEFSRNASSGRRPRTNPNFAGAPGISIHLTRHRDFRGTRIVPGYVFFLPATFSDAETHLYPAAPDRIFAYVASSSSVEEIPKESVAKTLNACCQSADSYATVHNRVFAEARSKSGVSYSAAVMESVSSSPHSFVGVLTPELMQYSSALKAAFCYMPHDGTLKGDTGTVFLDVFADDHTPHGHENNAALVHLITPRSENYSSVAAFLHAVTRTACHLMTALCDFNGFVKRQPATDDIKLRRIGVVRIGLPEMDRTDPIFANCSDTDLALATLMGLDQGYHFGPAPRIQFSHPAFKLAWQRQTCIEDESLQVTEGLFRRRSTDPR